MTVPRSGRTAAATTDTTAPTRSPMATSTTAFDRNSTIETTFGASGMPMSSRADPHTVPLGALGVVPAHLAARWGRYYLSLSWRRWTGIEPAGRGSPVPPALKAGEPTRHSDTSERQGNRRRGPASQQPRFPGRSDALDHYASRCEELQAAHHHGRPGDSDRRARPQDPGDLTHRQKRAGHQPGRCR